MSLSYVVDGETELDSELFNPWVDHMNGLQTGALPIALAGIAGALGADDEANGIANIRRFGAVGDGVTDDTAAIQSAIDSGAAVVLYPPTPSYYRTTDSLIPLSNQTHRSYGLQQNANQSPSIDRARIGGMFDGPVFSLENVGHVRLQGLTITGSSDISQSNNVGVKGTSANWCSVSHCAINGFAGAAIEWVSGVAVRIESNGITNSRLKRTGYSGYFGSVDLGGSDHLVINNEVAGGISVLADAQTAALVVRGANGFFSNNVWETSEVGVVVTSVNGFANTFVNDRCDLNLGHGYVVESGANSFVGCRSFRNSRAAHNSYDGFYVSGVANRFIGNAINAISADDGVSQMRYGFTDVSSPSALQGNLYLGNSGIYLGSGLFNVTSAIHRVVDFFTTKPTITGSREGNAALASLISALEAQGIILDGTS